ncbi:MAG: PfkB family carbohydrate kinase, partial [Acidobacteriota bacterium]|nr:PfkB family carbohydrate kinase [Acidobacteriota bacterium]
TMNFWIDSKRDALVRTLGRVGILLLNDGEARDLTGKTNVFEAADEIRAMGPAVVVIKRGEHGVIVADATGAFVLPAFPVRRVVDPTGAGDAFAGGFLGYLASRRNGGERDYRRAAVAGTVLASFQVEEFSLDRLRTLTPEEILQRVREFRDLTAFEDLTEL